MKILSNRILWGVLLVIGGLAFLLQNLGIIEFGGSIFGVLFLLAGLGFLAVLINQPEQWWAVFPGIILADLGTIILLGVFAPRLAEKINGPVFLAGISLCFWIVYLLQRQQWWAIIPGGVMLTLAVVSGVAEYFGGIETGGIFFLGLGLTFAVLSLVPTPQGRLRWALIPAGVLLLMGIILSAFTASILNYVWAIGLIGAGLYLFFVRRPSRQ
ncbi:MAG TPA: hypothetical protein VHO48_03860 [Anaerolineaceae bacterium]|nr:hypothetical protein [Anaerolineaceae bacterium]